MRNFKERRRLRNIMESRPVLGFLGILLLFSIWSVLGFFGKMESTAKNREIAKEKVLELEKGKAKLEEDIKKLESEKGVEGVLRENFGLAKAGEGLIIVVDEQNPAKPEAKDKGGFFNFFRNLFK